MRSSRPVRRGALLPFLLACLLGSASWGQDAAPQEPSRPAVIKIEVSPQEITVGGRADAEITLVWMGGAPSEPARFPTWQETWGGAEVLGASAVESFADQSGRHIFKQKVSLTAFEVGDVSLPEITVALPLGDETLEIRSEVAASFGVVSVLPEEPGQAAGPQAGLLPSGSQAGGPQTGGPQAGGPQAGGPPAAPTDEPAAELEARPSVGPMALEHAQNAFYASTAVLALLLMPSLFLLLRRLAAQDPLQSPSAARREIDPLTLMEPLDELFARLDRVDPDYLKPAHTGLSLALRRYLARRLGFNAVESTTTEIQRELRDLMLPADMGGRAVQMLRDCDMVKFAGVEVHDTVTRERVDAVRELGRRFEERFRPREVDDAAAAADPQESRR